MMRASISALDRSGWPVDTGLSHGRHVAQEQCSVDGRRLLSVEGRGAQQRVLLTFSACKLERKLRTRLEMLGISCCAPRPELSALLWLAGAAYSAATPLRFRYTTDVLLH